MVRLMFVSKTQLIQHFTLQIFRNEKIKRVFITCNLQIKIENTIVAFMNDAQYFILCYG